MTEESRDTPTEEKAIKRSKLHQDYWKDRVRQRSYKDANGQEVLLSEWQVYIQHLGRREWFQLGSTVKAAAGHRALPPLDRSSLDPTAA